MLESIPEPWVPYLVLLLNTVVFHIFRKIFLRFSPSSIQIIVAEIIATIELCSGCAELGVVYEIHGYIGFGIALLAVCLWWCAIWGDAEACPCGPFEECIFGSINSGVWKKLLGQAIGGAVTTLWINYIWSHHMTPEHAALHTAAECFAGLQVHMGIGALIEGFITMVSRVIAMESLYWKSEISLIANAVATTILVIIATSTTGGFFNPILASALSLGCKGNTVVEHFVVYWCGSLAGGFLGRYIFELRHQYDKLKMA